MILRSQIIHGYIYQGTLLYYVRLVIPPQRVLCYLYCHPRSLTIQLDLMLQRKNKKLIKFKSILTFLSRMKHNILSEASILPWFKFIKSYTYPTLELIFKFYVSQQIHTNTAVMNGYSFNIVRHAYQQCQPIDKQYFNVNMVSLAIVISYLQN